MELVRLVPAHKFWHLWILSSGPPRQDIQSSIVLLNTVIVIIAITVSTAEWASQYKAYLQLQSVLEFQPHDLLLLFLNVFLALCKTVRHLEEMKHSHGRQTLYCTFQQDCQNEFSYQLFKGNFPNASVSKEACPNFLFFFGQITC